ncbi:Mov34/MPN/PAD-1 family protein [Candidatus Woesearchaeota archaeon]|nr:Mov34/MPN/PAD-1 family protein [Candidatus Woesearchaeota archaeon]
MINKKQIIIPPRIIKNICEFAKSLHPKEFSCLVSGKLSERALTITGLVYQHFVSDSSSSVLWDNVPILSNIIGSVHSHPDENALPSVADKRAWSKEGGIHIIICYPYKKENIAVYNSQGKQLESASL